MITTKEFQKKLNDLNVSISLPSIATWLKKNKRGKKICCRWYCEEEDFQYFLNENRSCQIKNKET